MGYFLVYPRKGGLMARVLPLILSVCPAKYL